MSCLECNLTVSEFGASFCRNCGKLLRYANPQALSDFFGSQYDFFNSICNDIIIQSEQLTDEITRLRGGIVVILSLVFSAIIGIEAISWISPTVEVLWLVLSAMGGGLEVLILTFFASHQRELADEKRRRYSDGLLSLLTIQNGFNTMRSLYIPLQLQSLCVNFHGILMIFSAALHYDFLKCDLLRKPLRGRMQGFADYMTDPSITFWDSVSSEEYQRIIVENEQVKKLIETYIDYAIYYQC